MTENEFILADRLAKIQATINQYGVNNFYLSFSGGKDSTVLHYLLDMALPYNNIPRVYANTGIEFQAIVEFVKELAANDDRFQIITPKVPIKQMLEKDGYPFKSKMHSQMIQRFVKNGFEHNKSVKQYYDGTSGYNARTCPKVLKYQFEQPLPFPISSMCCSRMKKEPLKQWEKDNGINIPIIGIMQQEGGGGEKTQVAYRLRVIN